MTTIDRPVGADAAADAAVKAKHQAMWASGDYPALAHDLIADLGPALVDACRVRPGMRVLDVAAAPATRRSSRRMRAPMWSRAT